jgi:zinc protease
MISREVLSSRLPPVTTLKIRSLACLVLFMTSVVLPQASFGAGVDVTYAKLPNGLQIVVIPDRRAPVVTHMVWYQVGAADEPRGKSGIAHFLEHLMFKGTEKIAPGDFSKIVARNGGQDNAFTTQDATAYFQRVAKERLSLVMEMEADRMNNLRLLEDDVKNERQVILEERRSRVDNDPGSLLSEQMQAALFLAHPYGIPVIGWQHEMERLSRQDALSFYKTYYSPNNAIVVVAGDVEPQDAIKMAEASFGKVPAAAAPPARERVREPEGIAARRVILRDPRAAKATLSRNYLTPSYTTAKAREAESMEMLAAILGSTGTGRLYKKLVVEEKKASSAGAWFSGTGLDYGRFGIYAVPAGDTALESIEASMDAVLAEVRDNGVTDAEIERVRNSALADLVYDADNQTNLARTYGWALVTGRTIEDVKNREQLLSAVTVEDIQAAAQAYLDIRRSVTGYLLPDPKQVASSGPRKQSLPGAGDTIH